VCPGTPESDHTTEGDRHRSKVGVCRFREYYGKVSASARNQTQKKEQQKGASCLWFANCGAKEACGGEKHNYWLIIHKTRIVKSTKRKKAQGKGVKQRGGKGRRKKRIVQQREREQQKKKGITLRGSARPETREKEERVKEEMKINSIIEA